MRQDTHYELFGVNRNATPREIKAAFRTLAMRYHPDVTKLDKDVAEEMFKKLSQGYWILKNPQRRAKYDLALSKVGKAAKPDLKTPPRPPYEGPAPWERNDEYEWVWDPRSLRHYKVKKSGSASPSTTREVRFQYSFLRKNVRYRPKTRAELLREDIRKWRSGAIHAIGFWFLRRARGANLRYRLFMDWAHRRRFHALRRAHSGRPHKVMGAKRG